MGGRDRGEKNISNYIYFPIVLPKSSYICIRTHIYVLKLYIIIRPVVAAGVMGTEAIFRVAEPQNGIVCFSKCDRGGSVSGKQTWRHEL